MKPIKFGTDGWRAVIADGYTFDNVNRVVAATVRWLRAAHGEDLHVVLGHDTRFLGRAFAGHAARVFGAMGVRVTFADGFVPTPAVSWAAREYGAQAGIVITASHNPPAYNGYKVKTHLGAPAPPEVVAAIEAEVGPAPERDLPAFDALVAGGQVALRDVGAGYLAALRERLDLDAIRASGLRVVHDAMYGAGQGALVSLLGADRVVPLRHDHNPGFHGQAPEPIERNLGTLAETVVREGAAAGLANDGDADRIGMVDERGRFVTPHLLMALLVDYLHRERGLTGRIVKTVSTTHLLDRMGAAYGLPVETTPIGFKYIAPRIVEGDVLVGGEESGGIAVQGHLPERDGLYIGLLILEMLCRRGRPLSALVDDLFARFGPHHYHRVDVHTTPEAKERVLGRLRDEGGLDAIAGHAVTAMDTQDGFKHLLADRWLLVRPSGTEPVLRVYAEAPDSAGAVALVTDAMARLGVREG